MTRQYILGHLVVNGEGPEEERKRALEIVLARRFEPRLGPRGGPANLLSWQEACAGLTVRGFPVTQHQVKCWIKIARRSGGRNVKSLRGYNNDWRD